MQRSHNRHTYPADKLIPIEALHTKGKNKVWVNYFSLAYRQNPRADGRKQDKKFHTRKSRSYAKRQVREELIANDSEY